jgi:hypothetical protein
MRRLILPFRRTLAHTGHALALSGLAVLAMAAAPGAGRATDDDVARPAAPPVVAVVEPAGPVMREVGFEAPVRGFPVNSPFGMRRLAGEQAPVHTRASTSPRRWAQASLQPPKARSFAAAIRPTASDILSRFATRMAW